MTFPCTKCGQCCQHIAQISELSSFHDGNGVCYFYRKGIGCEIYFERPLACRVDEGYETFSSPQLSRHNYYQKNADVCNALQKTAGLNEQFRVKINDAK